MLLRLATSSLRLLATLWIILTFTFFLLHLSPGEPIPTEMVSSAETLKDLRHFHLLDRSFLEQYFFYLKKVTALDFGRSMLYEETTLSHLIAECFPKSAAIGLLALLIGLPLGIITGIKSALKKSSPSFFWSDLPLSIPLFVKAAILQYLFAIFLPFFPIAGLHGVQGFILPSLSLAFLPFAMSAKWTREQMGCALNSQSFYAASSRGLSQRRLIFFHALPETLFPFLAYLPKLLASLLMGSFIVEKIYGIAGLGHFYMLAILHRDYPIALGLTFFYSLLFLFFSFLAELLTLRFAPILRRRE